VSPKGVEDGTFWSTKASDYLRGYFHAAALAGYDMRSVAVWVSGAHPQVPKWALVTARARQWALTLAELRSEAQKTTATVRMVMSRALPFTADPVLAASVLPAPGGGLDIPAFLGIGDPAEPADTLHVLRLLAHVRSLGVRPRVSGDTAGSPARSGSLRFAPPVSRCHAMSVQ